MATPQAVELAGQCLELPLDELLKRAEIRVPMGPALAPSRASTRMPTQACVYARACGPELGAVV